MKINDRTIGILAIIGGALIYVGTLGLGEVPGQAIGSAFFPRIVAAAMALTGIAVAATAAPAPVLRLPRWMWERGGLSALGVLAAVVFWLVFVDVLGFLLATWIAIVGLAVLLGGRVLPAALISTGACLLFHLIFVALLRVPLPRGVVEGVLP